MTNPVKDKVPGYIIANSRWKFPVVKHDSHKNKVLAICGAGPSLRQHTNRIGRAMFKGDVWACNSALIWLHENGRRVTHGIAADQMPVMYERTWKHPPPVKYLLASSVDPHLIMHLKSEGITDITFFHNYISFENEYELYGSLYPSTCVVGDGLNMVNRAIAIAGYMGYRKILVLGADCALGIDDEWHADGARPEDFGGEQNKNIMEAVIDGRVWRSHIDLLYSAVRLVEQKRLMGRRLLLVGDTLPNAILRSPQYKKDPIGFLKTLPHFEGEWELREQQGLLDG